MTFHGEQYRLDGAARDSFRKSGSGVSYLAFSFMGFLISLGMASAPGMALANTTTTAPNAINGNATTTKNTAVSGVMMASDTNAAALPLTFTVISNPLYGSLSGMNTSTTGAFTYMPNTNFTGNDLFTFKANNGLLDSNVATETITVSPLSQASTSTSTAPTISNISATTTNAIATITWNTDQPANSQVAYGTTPNYAVSSTLDSNLVTNHTAILFGLTPNTLYHFAAMSANASGTIASSSDQTFTTQPNLPISSSTSSGSGSGTLSQADVNLLENLIQLIIHQIELLRQQISALQSSSITGNSNSTSTGSTSTSTVSGTTMFGCGVQGAPVVESADTVREGTTIDFGGRNFQPNEPVAVTSDGVTLTIAHADCGGNFSTGSLTVPMVLGQKTYTLHGEHSGIMLTRTITIIP